MKDCKKCLFMGAISAQTKSVFCSLNKEVAKMTCKDYIEKNDMPTWEQITRKNEVEQIAFNFGGTLPEILPTKKDEIKAYVSEMKKAKKMAEKIKKEINVTQLYGAELDFFNYGIK